MSLITFSQVDFSIGGPLLLERISFSIDRGERLCVVGRNGAGKSTLLKLMGGELHADDGEIRLEPGIRVARLAQEVPITAAGSVFDVVASALGAEGQLLADYHHLIHAAEIDCTALSRVQEAIEAQHAWSLEQRVERVLERLELAADDDFAALSGGRKRRVLLAQALVTDPDVLLLDEPTNHLDIEAIAWLETFLKEFSGCVVFVTHDRSFLRALATRILEIDRGELTSWPGDYENYLRRRAERLHAESEMNARFDKKLAEEEVWIRQGIKARRTRNEGRVRALQALRSERAQRRELTGTVKMAASGSQASGKRVIEAEHVDFGFGGELLIHDFSTVIQRGDRIGIIGPNGAGKTTLLKLLLGERQPLAGAIKLGSQLNVIYFDQHRSELREDWTAIENVAEGREFIEINGSRKHVIGYLQDFLFTPERARSPISKLSGGERNRLLLAKFLARPSNLLVMDEPTNDLDVETLDLLEEMLSQYPGTLILVSHDREFIDNVVTSTLALEGHGQVAEYVGGYSDWLAAKARASQVTRTAARPITPGAAASSAAEGVSGKRKLTYKAQRELEQLPASIEALEVDCARLLLRGTEASFYQQSAASIVAHHQLIATQQAALAAAYARWEQLEAEREALAG